MSNLVSNAFNLDSYHSGQVDPRTGQFSAIIRLATLRPEGPSAGHRDVKLTFSMNKNTNDGYGLGWSLNETEFNERTMELRLATGQQCKILGWPQGASTEVKTSSQGIKDFVVKYKTNIEIHYKDGTLEVLERLRSNQNKFKTNHLTFENGETISYWYDEKTGKLTHISYAAAKNHVLDITYDDNRNATSVTTHSTERRNSVVNFFYEEKNSSDSKSKLHLLYLATLPYHSDGVDRNRFPSGAFGYEYEPHGKDFYGITHIYNTMGGGEKITYDEKGLKYLTGHLYVVKKREIIPSCDQPKIVYIYEYSQNENFTGTPTTENFQKDTDNIDLRDDTYFYSSVEKLVNIELNNQESEIITRRYNKYHLMIEEKKCRNLAKKTTTFTYNQNPEPNKRLKDQPLNLRIPKLIVTEYENHGKKRSELVEIKSDDYGNILCRIEPSGIRTDYVYYPLKPQDNDPSDGKFVRFLKQVKITPSRSAPGLWDIADSKPETPDYVPPSSRQIDYTYVRLGESASYYRCETETIRNGDPADYTCKQTFSYETRGGYLHRGRLKQVDTTIRDESLRGKEYTTVTRMTYAAEETGSTLTETRTTTGHDGKTFITTRKVDRPTGLLLEISKPGSPILRFDYDVLGRLTQEAVAPGTENEMLRQYKYDYSAEKKPAQRRINIGTSDAPEAHGAYIVTYDGLGRPTSTHRIVGTERQLISQTRYDYCGRKVVDILHDRIGDHVLPLKSEYAYNDWNEISLTTLPNGLVHLSDRDYVANTLTTGVKGQNTTITKYNSFGQVAQIMEISSEKRNPASGEAEWDKLIPLRRQYDGFGRCVLTCDIDKNITLIKYDGFDRIVSTHFHPAGGESARGISIGYAAHTGSALQARVTVDGTELGQRCYDGLGRLIEDQKSGLKPTGYAYAENSAVPQEKKLPDGTVLKFAYHEALGALQRIEGPKGELASFEHDMRTGTLTCAKNPIAKHEYVYDANRHLQSDCLTLCKPGTAKWSATMRYSPAGRLHQVDLPPGADDGDSETPELDSETLEYDQAGRVCKIRHGADIIEHQFDTGGRLSETTATLDGLRLKTKRTFDHFSREASRTFSLNDAQFCSITCEYHNNGKLKSRKTKYHDREGDDAEEKFNYDKYSRLKRYTSERSSHPEDGQGRLMTSQEFTYDRLGRMIKIETRFAGHADEVLNREYSSSVPGQLKAVVSEGGGEPVTPAYDDAGNMINDGSGQTFTYDVFGRLSTNSRGGDYQYDALGRLVRQGIGTQPALKLRRAAGRLVAEVQEDRSIHYRRSGSETLARRPWPKNDWGTDGPAIEFNALDRSASVVSVVQPARKRIDRLYTPYGEAGKKETAGTDLLIDRQRIAFNGQRFDDAAGIYLPGNGGRPYSPGLMIFLTPDPLVPFDGAGYDFYAYCHGDPINLSDPSGLWAFPGFDTSPELGTTLAAGEVVLSVIVFGFAMAALIATGGFLLAIAAFGAAVGLLGALAGLGSAALTWYDRDNNTDNQYLVDRLNDMSVVLGSASFVLSGVGAGAKAGYKVLTSSGLSNRLSYAAKTAGAYFFGVGGKNFVGQLETNANLENIAFGAFNLWHGYRSLLNRGEAPDLMSTAAVHARDIAPVADPMRHYRPVIPQFDDPIARLHREIAAFDHQIARIRGSFDAEIYNGTA